MELAQIGKDPKAAILPSSWGLFDGVKLLRMRFLPRIILPHKVRTPERKEYVVCKSGSSNWGQCICFLHFLFLGVQWDILVRVGNSSPIHNMHNPLIEIKWQCSIEPSASVLRRAMLFESCSHARTLAQIRIPHNPHNSAPQSQTPHPRSNLIQSTSNLNSYQNLHKTP